MSPPPVTSHELETAEELLDRLQPTHPEWGGNASRWIFRGHSNARWELLPTAARKESWRPFLPLFDPVIANRAQREDQERTILKRFGNALDRAGLPVPLTREELDRLDSPTSHGLRWQDEYVELLSLAQHHGIPTRLLDFSRSGSIAAYFAAQDPPDAAANLCVWAIDGAFFSLRVESLPDAKLLRGSRALNPNQHAQDGVFAIWGQDGPLDQVITRIVSRVREAPAAVAPEIRLTLRGREAESLALGTMAQRFIVPRNQATTLLALLAQQRITGATIFPGVDGVVRGIKEWYQHGVGDYDLWSDR